MTREQQIHEFGAHLMQECQETGLTLPEAVGLFLKLHVSGMQAIAKARGMTLDQVREEMFPQKSGIIVPDHIVH